MAQYKTMDARLPDYIKSGLNKGSPIPLYKQVLNFLETYIVSGNIQPGTRLPTEAELQLELGISRVTIREALNAAVEAGLIVRKAGKGTFVAQNNTTPLLKALLVMLFTI